MLDFEFHAPDSFQEAADLVAQFGGEAKVMAGGTALTTMLKQSLVQPEHIVSLHGVRGGQYIARMGDVLHIGALATHRDVETSPLVREHAPLLAEVYSRVATVRIRNAATVGGGLAHADPAQDPLPAMLLMDASVQLTSAQGERVMPVSELFVDYYETRIDQDELITEVAVPTHPAGTEWVYLKYLPRTEDDYATVGVAAMGKAERGRIVEARVALGAVAPVPIRATAVEQALVGRQADKAAIAKAAEVVAELVDPLDDARGSAEYKRDMAVIFTRRALERVLGVS